MVSYAFIETTGPTAGEALPVGSGLSKQNF